MGTNKVKVGFTSQDPQVRLKGLQGANPDPLELCGFFWCPDGKAEKMCHDSLWEYKIHREWFMLPEDIVDETIEHFGAYYIEPIESKTEDWTRIDDGFIEEELDTESDLKEILPQQDEQIELPKLEPHQVRLRQLNESLTWRQIANLDGYKGVPAGTLCSVAQGRIIKNPAHRRILGLSQIVEIGGKKYELTEIG